MGRLLREFTKNYKLYAKILAGLALLSCATLLYLQRSGAGAGDEILISDLSGAGTAAEEDAAGAKEAEAADESATAGPGAAGGESSGGAPATSAPAEEAAPATIVVDVGGAVSNPTVLILPEGSRVYEALEAAGGLLPQADMREINRATPLKDGDRIYIPSREESAAKTPVPRSAGGGAGAGVTNPASSGASAEGAAAGADAPININTADSTELQRLSGVGPSTAQKILDYREAHGRFARVEDIKNVSGIGDKTFEKLKDKIAVD
ncbi:MAG: helix-hairpin-helix domain-containing protein [Clostridiales Family XIII bacterium]|jgi:competence protein ComEA|nr:helix-hairpin-helix domain-containing protein [Clostridiales Family XIII bacterium]